MASASKPPCASRRRGGTSCRKVSLVSASGCFTFFAFLIGSAFLPAWRRKRNTRSAKARQSWLTERCKHATDFCMRTTLDIDDRVLKQAKLQALERGETLTRFIEDALRSRLAEAGEAARLPPFRLTLLTKTGEARPGVDWDDRDSLYEHMEGRT